MIVIIEKADQDLYQYLHYRHNNNMPFEKNEIKRIFKEILMGVNHMHSNLIMHRDLKPFNILISKNGTDAKIADFGCAQRIDIFGRQKMESGIGK